MLLCLEFNIQACVGKETCSIDVLEKTFEITNCGDISKKLTVEAIYMELFTQFLVETNHNRMYIFSLVLMSTKGFW